MSDNTNPRDQLVQSLQQLLGETQQPGPQAIANPAIQAFLQQEEEKRVREQVEILARLTEQNSRLVESLRGIRAYERIAKQLLDGMREHSTALIQQGTPIPESFTNQVNYFLTTKFVSHSAVSEVERFVKTFNRFD